MFILYLYPCCSYRVVRRAIRVSNHSRKQAWWLDCWGLGSYDVFRGGRYACSGQTFLLIWIFHQILVLWLIMFITFQHSVGYLENTKNIMEASKRLQKGYCFPCSSDKGVFFVQLFCLPWGIGSRGIDLLVIWQLSVQNRGNSGAVCHWKARHDSCSMGI